MSMLAMIPRPLQLVSRSTEIQLIRRSWWPNRTLPLGFFWTLRDFLQCIWIVADSSFSIHTLERRAVPPLKSRRSLGQCSVAMVLRFWNLATLHAICHTFSVPSSSTTLRFCRLLWFRRMAISVYPVSWTSKWSKTCHKIFTVPQQILSMETWLRLWACNANGASISYCGFTQLWNFCVFTI